MRFVQIVDQRTGALLAEEAGWCATLLRRFHGLLLKRSLPEGRGIVLVPCSSVHMALMRFAIDVLFVDRENTVVKVVPALRPYRIALGGRRAHAAVELPAGTARRLDVQIGDRLSFETAPTALQTLAETPSRGSKAGTEV
jgi:uncharacterized membrane protein (UPF0127 family)